MNKKIIIYQLLPRLFGNDNTTHKPNGTLEENGCGKFNDIDHNALVAIHKLGATHVWYTGILEHATTTSHGKMKGDVPNIVKGKAGSPYAVRDYYDVDADLASNEAQRIEEFEALVQRTHDEGLGVIIDFVPNHVARYYRSDKKPKGVHDFGTNDDKGKHFHPQNNFYYCPNIGFAPQFDKGKYEEFPAKATGNDCFNASPSKNDWYETVKLNYGVDYCGNGTSFDPLPNTWLKMRHILLYWAGKGVDGFRCDMAEMVPVAFWHWVIGEVKRDHPNIKFIAEVYNPLLYRSYIYDGGFDYLYDKVGLYDTLRAVINDKMSASEITKAWQNVNDIKEHMLSFLENHDEQRIASSFFAGEAEKAIPAMMVATLISTAPVMCYFGQELGERGMDAEGFSGKDGRTTIFDYWSLDKIIRWRNKGKYDKRRLTPKERDLQQFYTQLFTLAKEPTVAEGVMYDLQYLNYFSPHYNVGRQYSFIRRKGDKTLLVVVNFENKEKAVEVHLDQKVFDFLGMVPNQRQLAKNALTGSLVQIEWTPKGTVRLNIPANNGIILKMKN